MNTKITQKIYTLALVLMASLFFVLPVSVRAMGPVVETGGNLVANIKNSIETTFQTFTDKQTWVKDFALDIIAFQLAEQVAQQMTSQITNWANSGFDGNPFFVDDIGGFFRDIARDSYEISVQQMVNEENPFVRTLVRADFLRNENPLQSLQGSLQDEFGLDLSDGFRDLRQVQSQGADAWGMLTQMHSGDGNIIGAGLSSEARRITRERREREALSFELMGANFLSDSTCLETNIERSFSDSVSGSNFRPGQIVETIDGHSVLVECIRSMTDTPSNLISDQLSGAISEPLARSRIPTEFQQMLANTFTSLVTNAIDQGIRRLRSGSDASSSASNVSTSTPIQDILNSPSEFYGSSDGQMNAWTDTPRMHIDLVAEINGHYESTVEIVNGEEVVTQTETLIRPGSLALLDREMEITQESLRLLQTTMRNAVRLDACIPGPGFGWQNRLRSAFEDNNRVSSARENSGGRWKAGLSQAEFAMNTLIPIVEAEMRNINYFGGADIYAFGSSIPSANMLLENIEEVRGLQDILDRVDRQMLDLRQTRTLINTILNEYLALENETDLAEKERQQMQLRYDYTQIAIMPSQERISQAQNQRSSLNELNEQIIENINTCRTEVAVKSLEEPEWGYLYATGDLFCISPALYDAWGGWRSNQATAVNIPFIGGPNVVLDRLESVFNRNINMLEGQFDSSQDGLSDFSQSDLDQIADSIYQYINIGNLRGIMTKDWSIGTTTELSTVDLVVGRYTSIMHGQKLLPLEVDQMFRDNEFSPQRYDGESTFKQERPNNGLGRYAPWSIYRELYDPFDHEDYEQEEEETLNRRKAIVEANEIRNGRGNLWISCDYMESTVDDFRGF